MPEARPAAAPVRDYLLDLQDRICGALESADGGARFQEQRFEEGANLARPRVLAGGEVIEKAAVHFTSSSGPKLPAAATERRPELAGRSFEAVSLSPTALPAAGRDGRVPGTPGVLQPSLRAR